MAKSLETNAFVFDSDIGFLTTVLRSLREDSDNDLDKQRHFYSLLLQLKCTVNDFARRTRGKTCINMDGGLNNYYNFEEPPQEIPKEYITVDLKDYVEYVSRQKKEEFVVSIPEKDWKFEYY